MNNESLASFFILLFLTTPIAWIYSVIKKDKFNQLVKKDWSGKKISSVFFGLLISSFIGIGIFAEPVESPQNEQLESNVLSDTQVDEENINQTETEISTQEASPEPEGETAKVTRVIDGDTIELENGQKLRYIGIDTPESKDPNKPVECFSKEATQKNKDLVLNKTVRLEKDVSETDRYGRLLRYVYVDDRMINEFLVREGYANASAYPPDIKHQEVFKEAETEAREVGRGLWGEVCLASPTPLPTPTSKPTSIPTIKPTSKPASVPTSQSTTAPIIQQVVPVPTQQPIINTVPTTNSTYSCSCSKTCSQMSSCDEAYYQLNTCGCSRRDGDDDGVPCESICPGG